MALSGSSAGPSRDRCARGVGRSGFAQWAFVATTVLAGGSAFAATPPAVSAGDKGQRAAAPEGGGGGGSGSAATSAASPAVDSTPSVARQPVPDLARLRAEYDRLREALFKARVRSQKAAEAAYRSKLDARLRWNGGPDFVIRKARFLLDGAELWDSADRGQTDNLIEVAERSVKPGPHAFTVHLEIRPKTEAKGGAKTGAEKLGYTSEHTFAIVVAETGRTRLLLTGDEDGDPPEYEPELELEVKVEQEVQQD